ncbi:type II toxin-antitoxin system RelE/ParE family toxin [Accumulibacter sp.]|uniref:type II toxin-antitoxin system RelE/ParE family toxin n=1 Tax=Accumulibacter sp. TaxID=2053492 RepID=UPI0025D1078C|nr:type II toxin-antitoxin system RelE/ParE family toxin [Accumulibacter sp.]MCM8596347.1 type II toxin-antitoxin system RelE/ParE family toxin [Accumulibacter sp.]MCM8627481.1 type II toxin-antitoxin system RelE/ParE family toxin [Accumulibacter sp.]MDS4050496.1 type II toxin-antitoxin system RelE/ParE family toxin [Accumulibacter sp.]
MGGTPWTLRLSAAAENDYRLILRWTARHSGEPLARSAAKTLADVLEQLCADPLVPASMERSEIGRAIRTIEHAGQPGKVRHLVVFRTTTIRGQRFVDVLRLLHASVDCRHPSGIRQ